MSTTTVTTKDNTPSLTRIESTASNVSEIVSHLEDSNMFSTVSLYQLSKYSFDDWVQAFNQYSSSLLDGINSNVSGDLKPEVQDSLRREFIEDADASFFGKMDTVGVQLQTARGKLLSDIKSKKSPLYSKANTLGMPDYEAMQVGATELANAQSIPLKYIDVPMLQNAYDAGRTDFVSALCERIGLNRGEMKPHSGHHFRSGLCSIMRELELPAAGRCSNILMQS